MRAPFVVGAAPGAFVRVNRIATSFCRVARNDRVRSTRYAVTRRHAFAAALLALGALAFASPALAVDRSAGAGVPKPSIAGTPWSDADIATLDAALDRAMADDALRGAHAGLLVVDARDGRTLYARNADDAFQPASTLKLLAGSVALERLGPSFRFRTEVFAAGTIAAGVLDGTLVLRGGGDPFLGAADLDAAAAAVAASGVTRVTRGVAIDDTHGEHRGYLPGWSLDDVPYAYEPVLGALAFEHDAVRITVSPGDRPGDRAHVGVAPGGRLLAPVEGCAPTVDVRVVNRAVRRRPAPATRSISRASRPAASTSSARSRSAGRPTRSMRPCRVPRSTRTMRSTPRCGVTA